MDGKTPGDGKTSPFGKNGGPMPGNDFNKNPAGSAPGGRGVNFLEQPSGSASGGAPADPLQSGKGAQKSGTDDANPQSEIKSDGGPGLRPDASVPGGSARQQFIGTGSIGDSRKPFKGISLAMGAVAISGTILGGPPQIGVGFPQAIFTTTLATTPNPKPFSAATGVLSRRVSQAGPGFIALSGVGPSDTVIRGDLLYLRCDSQLLLRLSQQDPLNPAGPALARELYVSGLVVLEFPPSSPLVLLEAQGSATIEYAITGQ